MSVVPNNESVLARLAKQLQARVPGLVVVYRFGSFATSGQRPNSDIDLGLQAVQPLDPVSLFDLAGELSTMVGRDVDLVDLLRCSTVLRAQVVDHGERILCNDATRADAFAATAFSMYAELNLVRQGILQDVRQQGRIHGG